MLKMAQHGKEAAETWYSMKWITPELACNPNCLEAKAVFSFAWNQSNINIKLNFITESNWVYADAKEVLC